MRKLEAAAADVWMIGRDAARRRRPDSPRCRPWSPGWPSTRTWPARISARARSRDGARPRSTTQVIEPDAWHGGHSECIDPGARTWRQRSIRALDDPPADAEQVRIGDARVAQRQLRARSRHSAAMPLRRVEAVERRIGRLAGRGILARRLAELSGRRPRRRGCRRQSETPGRSSAAARSIASICSVAAAAHDGAGLRRRRESALPSSSRACVVSAVGIERRRRRPAGSGVDAREIDGLAADHADWPGRRGR